MSSDQIANRIVEGRAAEAVIWGMSAVNTVLMYDEMKKMTGR
jgi:hypothetical protein